jgi:hypothetical protein
MKHFFGLTFLPPEEVGESFVEDFISGKPNDERLDKFVDYLVDNYIEEIPSQVWADCSVSIERSKSLSIK